MGGVRATQLLGQKMKETTKTLAMIACLGGDAPRGASQQASFGDDDWLDMDDGIMPLYLQCSGYSALPGCSAVISLLIFADSPFVASGFGR